MIANAEKAVDLMNSTKADRFEQVDYGSTDLSRAAIEYRRANNISAGRNVAVFEYKGMEGSLHEVAMESRGQHSERRIAGWLEQQIIAPQNVTRIYSELEPCTVPFSFCKDFIKRNYPQAATSYSFEYGDTMESRRRGMRELKLAVREATRTK